MESVGIVVRSVDSIFPTEPLQLLPVPNDIAPLGGDSVGTATGKWPDVIRSRCGAQFCRPASPSMICTAMTSGACVESTAPNVARVDPLQYFSADVAGSVP